MDDGKVAAERSFDGLHMSVAVNDIFADPGDDIFALNQDGSMLAVSFYNGGLIVFDLEQPNEANEADGSFYYLEHQPTRNNRMEILARDGNRLKIRVSGSTEDVNYYDGSKPENRLQLTAWFEKEHP